jgi:hypothetical protein
MKTPCSRLDRAIVAGQKSRPTNLAKVGVAGSNPVVRSRKASLAAGFAQTSRWMPLGPLMAPTNSNEDVGPVQATASRYGDAECSPD